MTIASAPDTGNTEHLRPVSQADVEGDILYPALRHFWHPVAYSSALTGGPLGVVLLDQDVLLFRHGADIVAMDDRCVHRGTKLSLGRVVPEGIECAYHGWRYDSAGRCTHVPASPELSSSVKTRPLVYRATESAGLIWVCLGEPRAPVPAFPEFDRPGYRLLQGPTYDWRTSAARRLENFCDFAHFSFIHEGTLGSRSHATVKPVESWREGHVLRLRRSGIMEPSAGFKKTLLGITEEWIAPVNEYHITLPHTVRLERIFPNGNRYALLMSASPVSAAITRSFWWQARDFGLAPEHDSAFLNFELKILAEDINVVESQRPVWIPLRSGEVSLTPPDQVSLAYRRALRDIARQNLSPARP